MRMTYRDLKKELDKLSDKQLDLPVIVCDAIANPDFPYGDVLELQFGEKEYAEGYPYATLNEGHPYLAYSDPYKSPPEE